MSILVFGGINMDVVAQSEHLPRPGETVLGRNLGFFPGGKGSNQAVAASRLSDGVRLVAKLGRDGFGEQLLHFLKGENLDLTHLLFSDSTPTGTALIVVDDASENIIIAVPGCNAEISAEDVAEIPLEGLKIVMAEIYVPQASILSLFERARRAGLKTILSPTPVTTLIDGLLDASDYVLVNAVELAYYADLERIENIYDLDELLMAARKLQTRPDQIIVITLGAAGCACLRGDALVMLPGRPVKAIDTTGAGDCFAGSLAVALSEGLDIQTALSFANASAALSVQKMGAATSMPSRAAVEEFLEG